MTSHTAAVTSARTTSESTAPISARDARSLPQSSPASTRALADAYSSSVSSPFACRSASEASLVATSVAGARDGGGRLRRCRALLVPPARHAVPGVREERRSLRVGKLEQRLTARQLDPGRAERDDGRDDEQAREVEHRGGQEHREPDDREHDIGPHAILQSRCEPAAGGQRAPARACKPRREEEQEPDDDHQPERPPHELREDVPRVSGSLAIVASGDERVDDVVLRQPRGRDADESDDDQHDAYPADRASAIACEPDGEAERGEREQGEHPREGLQELEHVLCRVELVGAQDDDLAGVVGDPVDHLVADPDPIRGFDDDRSQVEDHLAFVGRHAIAAAFEHLDEGRMRLLERDAEEILEHRLLEGAVDDLVRRLAQTCGRGPREALVVRRQLLLDLGLDVHVREELVHGPVRHRASDLVVVEERARRVREDARVEGDAVDPDGERGEEQEEPGDDEHDPHGGSSSAALSARCLGGGGVGAHALEETTARRAKTQCATREPPSRRPSAG